ncbi:hypothetical protein KIW84_074167 [Lathyrus oleraceus]|uniref:Uncharacterized protein n=1 Tax=Pisum sativum TaxID=3888 RepID=A0A9D4VT19_PEA|nr:hypothetical protein KIW84_074167 [Pisum sativum]
MDSDNYDQEFWELVEEEFMDDSDEEEQLQNERRSGNALGNHDEYFQMRVDATGKMSLSPLQKCTSAIRMLAYGSPADLVDEYVRIGESTSIECLERFVKGVNVVFGAEYLRKPNNTDVEHLLQMGESRGFPANPNSEREYIVIIRFQYQKVFEESVLERHFYCGIASV